MCALTAGTVAYRRSRRCLQAVYSRAILTSVDTTQDRLVIVSARLLDDLLELSRIAADRIGDEPVASALNGARAQVLASALSDPL